MNLPIGRSTRVGRENNCMFHVYVLDSADGPYGTEAEVEQQVLEGCARVELVHVRKQSDFDALAPKADALLVWRFRNIGEHILSRATRARVVVRGGIGFDGVDLDAAAALGIPICNVPDYATEEVADHAIALALALVRQIRPLSRHVAGGGWEWKAGEAARRLRELTFGIVGCGRIGTATALRARALGFRVLFHDPYVAPGYERGLGVERVSTLQQLLSASDVVSLHVPLTPETRHLLDTAAFEAMRPGSYLVNTSRGGVVRHEALMVALENGLIAGAGLDVLEREPEGALDLLAFPNVLVTPHAAFYSVESHEEVRRTSAAMIRDVLERGRLRNVVNGVTDMRSIR